MPDTCSAVGCKNRRLRKRGCGGSTDDGTELHFYRIPWGRTPQKMEKRRLWMQAICRTHLPEHARICSAHFVSGVASDDPEDPDYVPSLFSYNSHIQHVPSTHTDKCCVPNCCNDSRYNQTQSLSFHPFPKSPELRNRWAQKLEGKFGEDLQVTKHTRICSRHFRKSDIVTDKSGMKVVKPQVLPSKFHASRTYLVLTVLKQDTVDGSLSEVTVQDRSDLGIEDGELEEGDSAKTPARSSTCDLWPDKNETQDVLTRLALANDRINALEAQCKTLVSKLFFLERFSNDSECIEYYTGFADYETLKSIYMALEPLGKSNSLRWTEVQRYCELTVGTPEDRRQPLPLIDQFFMVLCYVRRGFCDQDLAVRFSQSVEAVTYNLFVWINYLFISLRKFQIWPSRKMLDATMPGCFRSTYPSTRVILDCTEVTVEMPGAEIPGRKNSDVILTFKGLLGISPSGAVTFVSDLYHGSMSNYHIMKASRVLNLVIDPCTVMAHESFRAPDTCKSSVLVPPFWTSDGETQSTPEMMALKRHVEQALARIKDYRVFQTVIPRSLAESANEIWMLCALLANFKTSLHPAPPSPTQ